MGWKGPLAVMGARWAVARIRRRRAPEPPPRSAARDALGLLPWALAGAGIGLAASALSRDRTTYLTVQVRAAEPEPAGEAADTGADDVPDDPGTGAPDAPDPPATTRHDQHRE